MRKLILGILMLRQLNVYEIRNIVRQNFKEMCSDSLGSIQTAVKKLLAEGKISLTEYVENGVNKKRYAITDDGRAELMEWLSTPADLTVAKNAELGKLLFMGLVPEEERAKLIDELIAKIEQELVGLRILWELHKNHVNDNVAVVVDYWNANPDYKDGILEATKNLDVVDSAVGIGTYQILTLEFGIANLQFAVDWFKAFRERMEDRDEK